MLAFNSLLSLSLIWQIEVVNLNFFFFLFIFFNFFFFFSDLVVVLRVGHGLGSPVLGE